MEYVWQIFVAVMVSVAMLGHYLLLQAIIVGPSAEAQDESSPVATARTVTTGV